MVTEIDFRDLEQEIIAADTAEQEAVANWMAAIIKDYEDDSPDRLTLGEICLKHGITQQELIDIRDLAGVDDRRPIERPPTPEVLAAAGDYVTEGISARRAADRHGVDYQSLLYYLQRTGQKRPRTHKEIPDEAIEAYQNGEFVEVICRRYKAKDGRRIHIPELYNELRRRGVETRAEGKWRRALARTQHWLE